jgi:hypothetical protein
VGRRRFEQLDRAAQQASFSPFTRFTTEAKAWCAMPSRPGVKIAIVYQNDDYGKNGVQGAQKNLKVSA